MLTVPSKVVPYGWPLLASLPLRPHGAALEPHQALCAATVHSQAQGAEASAVLPHPCKS